MRALSGLVVLTPLTVSDEALGHAPIHTLRPAFLQLGYRAVFDAIWLDVIQCLSLSLPNENEAPIQPWTNAVDDMFRKEFRKSLTIALYGWEDLHSTRLRLAVADACWVRNRAVIAHRTYLTFGPENEHNR